MTEPSPRQVLYVLVTAGIVMVVGILVVGAAVAGLVPTWWTASIAAAVVLTAAWSALNWRRTVPVLVVAIGLFASWAIGTLILAQ